MPLATSLQVPSPEPGLGPSLVSVLGHNFRHVSCAVLCRSHDLIASPLSTIWALYCLCPFAMSVTLARGILSPGNLSRAPGDL